MKTIHDPDLGMLVLRDLWEGATIIGGNQQEWRLQFDTIRTDPPSTRQRSACIAVIRFLSDSGRLRALENAALGYAYDKGMEGFALDKTSMPHRTDCSCDMLLHATIFVPIDSVYDAAIEWSSALVAGHGVRVLFAFSEPIGLALGGDDEVERPLSP